MDADLLAQHRAVVDAQNRRSSDAGALLQNYQSALTQARAARPGNAVVEWLTGDLLMSVGGEPEAVLPYFARAVQLGIREPEAFAAMARVQLELHEFDAAYHSAVTAVEGAPADESVWRQLARIGFITGQFGDVHSRISRAFPANPPPWAVEIASRADAFDSAWNAEQQRREADRSRHLTHVVFTIRHEAFRNDPANPSAVVSTPDGDVELELYDGDAPATVRNFVRLTGRAFYDGTRFHWVKGAGFVVGGDPNTRNADPSDDGRGGPGYMIPDEAALPMARAHFRGVISMLETTPGTAGSQFLICLVTCPEFDGRMTAFGRVIRGQEVLDRMKPGRTAIAPGEHELSIPGDVLLTARVLAGSPLPPGAPSAK